MRYLMILLVFLSACTTMHKFDAAPQSYRLKGEDKPLEITGTFDVKRSVKAISTEFDMKVSIFIDNNLHIFGSLDRHLSGEFKGSDYQGKKTSASCTGKPVTKDAVEVRCIVFIDNERTVTLTF